MTSGVGVFVGRMVATVFLMDVVKRFWCVSLSSETSHPHVAMDMHWIRMVLAFCLCVCGKQLDSYASEAQPPDLIKQHIVLCVWASFLYECDDRCELSRYVRTLENSTA